MKLLKDILYKVSILEVMGNTGVALDSIQFDSRKVTGFSLFVAVRGTQSDGHEYISQAIAGGACAVLCEELPEQKLEKVTYIKVEDSAEALGRVAANFYDNPSEKLKLIGITGTNGKTTTVTLLFDLFRGLGYKVGLLSTVVNRIGKDVIEATHTTPDPIQLQQLLQQMVDAKVTHCFMEVSSHAIHQKRIAGATFDVAAFTNITHDHLDYHKTFNEYIAAKKAFFDTLPRTAHALYNGDDVHGEVMVQNTKAKTHSFAVKSMADFRARIIENQFNGLHLMLDGNDLYSKLVGGFNAYNLLTAYAIALLLEEDKLSILTAISNLNPVAGRFQYTRTEKNVVAIIDYAHTPDALKNVLKTIQEVRTGNEKVITVVGCGGDRDKTKRPLMASVACDFADKVILTSDNPRTENPDLIIADMKTGVEGQHFKKTLAITDRREAIRTAVTLAEPGDILLVAGKGHEKYQEINGERFPFDDFEIVTNTLQLFEK